MQRKGSSSCIESRNYASRSTDEQRESSGTWFDKEIDNVFDELDADITMVNIAMDLAESNENDRGFKGKCRFRETE